MPPTPSPTPHVRSARSLAPVDITMKGTYRTRFHDALIVLPIGDIDKATPSFDRTPVFGACAKCCSKTAIRGGSPPCPPGSGT